MFHFCDSASWMPGCTAKTAFVAGAVGVGAVVAAPFALAAAGFGSAGVVAGSLAAGWQVCIDLKK